MVSIDEINITQLDALAGRGQGEFDDDVDEDDEEEQDEFDKSGEKLRLETEAGATQDSTYTPEIEASPSTVGSKGTRKWDDLHPISSGPRIDQELLKLSKIAAEKGLIKPKGKTSLQEWNEQQEATRHWKAQLKGGRRTTSNGPTSSRSTSSGATSSRSTSSGATSTHDARGREKKRLLLEKTIDEDPRPLESLKSNETVDLTGEKGNSPTHVFGSPSIEATFAEL
jgi:hypothetical protein